MRVENIGVCFRIGSFNKWREGEDREVVAHKKDICRDIRLDKIKMVESMTPHTESVTRKEREKNALSNIGNKIFDINLSIDEY